MNIEKLAQIIAKRTPECRRVLELEIIRAGGRERVNMVNQRRVALAQKVAKYKGNPHEH